MQKGGVILQHIVKIWMLAALLMLAGCSLSEPRPITLPDDIAEVSDKFVEAIKSGDMESARKYVDSEALESFDKDSAKDGNLRGDFSDIEPYSMRQTPQSLSNLSDRVISVTYARNDNGRWTVLEIDLLEEEDNALKVESWFVAKNDEMPRNLKNQMRAQQSLRYGGIGIAVLLAAFLAFFVWLIKRKPTLIAPDTSGERRAAAITTRNDETTKEEKG